MPSQPAGDTDNERDQNSVDELTGRNLRKILEREQSTKSDHSQGERLAAHIAAFCGSMPFIWLHVAFFCAWIVLNTSLGIVPAMDPFPFFFLSFVVSLEAIFLSAFILISQNHETLLTERRNQLDLQINMLAEQENTKMLEILQLIAKKVGISDHDAAAEALLETLEPAKLVEEIMSAKQEDPNDASRKGA